MTLIQRIGKLLDNTPPADPANFRGERASERFNTQIRAWYPDSSFMQERRGNVSIGGFCFEAERGLAPGTRVRLLIELTGTKHWIRITGKVLGTIRTGKTVGIRGRFSHIHVDDERLLARWLDEQTRANRAA
jgi:hypothetical protein